LLNLTGFFSRAWPVEAFSAVVVDISGLGVALKGALTKGCRGLRCLRDHENIRAVRERNSVKGEQNKEALVE
jgi:hypothetical protein